MFRRTLRSDTTLAVAALLLVDDDEELAEMLGEYLRSDGFEVLWACDGSKAMALLKAKRFDLVILDVMLADMTGFDLLRRLQASTALPVVMLTARTATIDRILGLELGADDYLAKPFSPRELAARIRAVLRRCQSPSRADGGTLELGPLRINAQTIEAFFSGKQVRLTITEFRLLEILMRNAGQLQSRAALTERVLGRKLNAYDRSIDTHVSHLRAKLGLSQESGIEIRNARGAGYLLVQAERTE